MVEWSKYAQSVWQQWRQLWAKIGLLPIISQGKWHMILKLKSGIKSFKRITIWSWNEGDMANWSNVAQRACCYGIVYRSNSFWLFGLNFGPLLGFYFFIFFVAIGPFGFSILTNPIFGCRVIFGNLDLIQILITKYVMRSLKAMEKVSIFFILLFYFMLLINCIHGLKTFWYS